MFHCKSVRAVLIRHQMFPICNGCKTLLIEKFGFLRKVLTQIKFSIVRVQETLLE